MPDVAPPPTLPPQVPPDAGAEAKAKFHAMKWGLATWCLGLLPQLGWLLKMLLKVSLFLLAEFAAHGLYFAVAGNVYVFLLVAGYQSLDEFFAVPIHRAIPALWEWKYYVQTRNLTMAHFFACFMVIVVTVAWEGILHFADDSRPASVVEMIWRTACLGAVVVEPILFFVGMWYGGKSFFVSLLMTAFVTVTVIIFARLLSLIWRPFWRRKEES